MSSSDHDHQYKLLGKRLAWALGYVPLINVPVTLPADASARAGTDLTDADVYGFRFSASGDVSSLLIDCKTASGRAVDRVLWVRGLRDLLDLDDLYLFKKKIPDGARWLARKLSVNCLDEKDLADLDGRLGLSRLKGPYFDGSGYECIEVKSSFPKGSEYRALAQFLKTGLWNLTPAHRVLTLLHLGRQNEMCRKLRVDDPSHVCLVLLGARGLAISMGLLASRLNVTDVLNIEERLRQELHGGAESLAQKTRFAEAIRRLTGKISAEPAIDHEGFPALLEEVNRLLIRRYALNDAVRITDLALHYSACGATSLPRQLSGSESTLSVKIASDILSLFVKINSLDREFCRVILNLITMPTGQAEPAATPSMLEPDKDGQHPLLSPLPPLDIQ